MFIPQSLDRHPEFDKDEITENFPPPWTWGRIKSFQDKLDKIAGLSSNGRSNVRLIWASDPNESISMHVVKDAFGNEEKRARYGISRETYHLTGTDLATGLEVVQEVEVDIVPPRWIIEEFHEPDEEGFNHSTVDTRGRGFYTHLWTVGAHTPDCCNGREVTADIDLCLGLYREPSEIDLTELQRRIRLRDAEIHGHRPGERVSQNELADGVRDFKAWEEKQSIARRMVYADALKQSFKTHGWKMFNHDPGKKSNYHFLTPKPKDNQ